MEIESEMKTKFIPMHRIRRIAYDGETMWEKSIAEPCDQENIKLKIWIEI